MKTLEGAATFLGPLKPEAKGRLEAFFRAPSAETWEGIYRLQIAPRLRVGTVWAAVLAVDPTFPAQVGGTLGSPPSVRWPCVPDVFTVAKAVRLAVAKP